MSKKIKIEDFVELAFRLKPSLESHGVPDDLHYSLISDTLFSIASFLDEKTGTNFHAEIDSLLDDYAEELNETREGDYLIAEIDILFEKGRKCEMNLLKSHLDNSEHMQLILEMALELRDVDEIDKAIDIDSRLLRLLKKKNGIKSLKFNSAQNIDKEDWFEVPLAGSVYGEFEQSLSGVEECIREVAKQWL